MYEFNSIQEALSYIFEGKNIAIINIPGTPHPWFFADDIREILEYGYDNRDMTKHLYFKNETVAVLNINDEILKQTINPVSRFGGARRHMIISLPGVFELVTKSRAPKAREFQHWLYFIVLPTLYHNPQMAKQISDLNTKLENSVWKTNAYRNECIDLRKEKIALNKHINELNNKMEDDDDNFYQLVDICQRYKNLLDENGIYY